MSGMRVKVKHSWGIQRPWNEALARGSRIIMDLHGKADRSHYTLMLKNGTHFSHTTAEWNSTELQQTCMCVGIITIELSLS